MKLNDGRDGGKLWLGRHSADGDTLVLDPARPEPLSGNVSLFSLTEFRPRVFPPEVVERQIDEILDSEQRAEALEQYRNWPTLKAERDRERESDRAREREEVAARQKERTLEKHRAFVERLELPYEGTRESSAETKTKTKSSSRNSRRTACYVCGIKLDDFVASRCVACSSVLCSCGACACGQPRKGS